MRKAALRFVFCMAVCSTACVQSFATEGMVDAGAIEAVMRKYQDKYHYVAQVNNYSSKYLTWPSHHCTSAPSYPIDFYGEITDDKAEELVDSIVSKFYETSQYSDSNISGLFLESLPDGRMSQL